MCIGLTSHFFTCLIAGETEHVFISVLKNWLYFSVLHKNMWETQGSGVLSCLGGPWKYCAWYFQSIWALNYSSE